MLAPTAPIDLDVTTLFFVATCITALLGLFLLFAWLQDRIRALAWWGGAYLIGGFSVAVWSIESLISPPLPPGLPNALLFIACGMIWNAARLFHGRSIRWGALFAGATVWLLAGTVPHFLESGAARIVLSSIIVSSYTFLTALELWRERRKRLLRRWPAIFVPILHGAVFLFPIPLAGIIPADRGVIALSSGWIAVFTLETMLYVVGTAFIVLVLSKERAVRIHKDAASTDELTRLLNRRGFVAAARQLMAAQEKNNQPVSVLLFDLDHFKSINDRFGHAVGDEAIKLFAATASSTMRASDIIGRFGGEEFVAMVPGPIADAAVAAERVRSAFQAAAVEFAGHQIAATVSIGVTSGAATAHIETLIASADGALYRAKNNGRNRLEIADEPVPGVTAIRAGAAGRPKPTYDPEARATQLLQAAEQRAA
jgi:diguanylate cyclase (GGDEF)-like protein